MNHANKIVELEELANICETARAEGKKIVQCHGVFDLLHPGHVRHFKAARAEGDVLIVTLTPDEFVNKGPGRPVFNHRLRAEWIAELESVDYVAVNRWPSAVETIRILRPAVFVKGNEFASRGVDVTGNISAEEQAVGEVGGRLHLTEEITFSSSRLLNAYFSDLPAASDNYLSDFRRRYSANKVLESINALNNLKVAVVGDAIVDEYYFCRPMGLGSKSNAVNARYLSTEVQAGGALAVANHVAGFVRDVHLVSCLGQTDSQEDAIRARLKSNVSTKFFQRANGPTTVKRRYVAPFQWQKLFEISFIEDSPLPSEEEAGAAEYLAEILKDYDAVIVADFGHGFLGSQLIESLSDHARYLTLNVQTNSANAGFNLATKYPRADYLCLDEEELRYACHDRFGEVGGLMTRIERELKTDIVAVTQGQRGSIARNAQGSLVQTPVFSQQVLDTIGAGDAYLALSSLCAAGKLPLELMTFIGNCAGALLTRELGNRVAVEPVPLFRFITTLLK